MYWPEDVSSYYRNAISNLKKSDVRVYCYDEFLRKVYTDLENFLLVGKNDTILIKTSVTGKRRANHEINNEILEEVICSSRKLCPKSKIILADGPAYTESYYLECCKLKWDYIAKKYNIEIIDLNKGEYKLIFDHWPVAKLWFESDKIINMCKVKTHKRFGVSLSLKNLLGIFSGEVMGYPKFSYKHEYVPRLLYELDKLSSQRLNIIDGYYGIEGNGPMHGRPTKSNFIIIGTDSYSCDFQGAIEMGFAPAAVIATIRPFMYNCINYDVLNEKDIINLKNTNIDFYPHISCAWMFKSLYWDFNKLNDYYKTLMVGIKQCWNKKI